MKPANPFALVKECKGAALSILVLLQTNRQLGGGAVTQEWLERHSGYSDKPVSQALNYLSETGRIVSTAAGWVLVDPLPAPGSPPPPEPGPLPEPEPSLMDPLPARARRRRARKTAGLAARQAAGGYNPAGASRNISDSPTTTSAIDPLINPDQAEEEEGGVGIFPTRAILEHVEANLAAFKKWGVGRNEKTIVLSSRPEVTPEQIDAIAHSLINEKRFSTGLLITAVQSNDRPVPNLPSRYGPREEVRDPAKYAEWEK